MSVINRTFRIGEGTILDNILAIMSRRDIANKALSDLALKVDAISAHVDEKTGIFVGFMFSSDPSPVTFVRYNSFWAPNMNTRSGQRVARMIFGLPPYPVLNQALSETPLNPVRSWLVDNETGERHRANVIFKDGTFLLSVPEKQSSMMGGDSRFGDLDAEMTLRSWEAPSDWVEVNGEQYQ